MNVPFRKKTRALLTLFSELVRTEELACFSTFLTIPTLMAVCFPPFINRFLSVKHLSGLITSRITRRELSMSEPRDSSSSPVTSPGEDRSKCIFCKICDGKEENEVFYQDDEIVVFQDIKPASTHHLLVVPRAHIPDAKSLLPSQLPLLLKLVSTGEQVLLQNLQKSSPDTKDLAGLAILQGFHWPPFHTVSHLHLHLIAPSDKMGFISRTIFRPNSFWFVTPDYVKQRLEKMPSGGE